MQNDLSTLIFSKESIDAGPKFYNEFDYPYFLNRFAGWPEADEKMFDDAEVLFFPSKKRG